jgi:hypothetical protein
LIKADSTSRNTATCFQQLYINRACDIVQHGRAHTVPSVAVSVCCCSIEPACSICRMTRHTTPLLDTYVRARTPSTSTSSTVPPTVRYTSSTVHNSTPAVWCRQQRANLQTSAQQGDVAMQHQNRRSTVRHEGLQGNAAQQAGGGRQTVGGSTAVAL